MKTSAPIPGIGFVYAGTILGLAASLGFNIGHAVTAPEGAPADWSPSIGRILFGAFLPLAAGILLEVVTRVAWPAGRAFAALRFVGVGGVGVAAGYVSFLHTSGLLAAWGEDRATQVLGALAVDGLLLVCSCALVLLRAAASRAAKPAPAPAESAPAAPVEVAPTWDTPRPVPVPQPVSWAPSPGVLVAACEEPEPAPVEEPAEVVEEPEPADPRYATELTFSDPLPARGQGRAAEIRRRAEAFSAENPDRSQSIVAELVGVSRRSLRDALAATEPAQPTGLRLVKSEA